MTTLTPVSILYSIAIPLVLFFILTKISLLDKLMSLDSPGKYVYLYPVRVIAALLVFIHHSIMVYNQHTTGKFSPGGMFNYESTFIGKIYVHFGQTSVMIFFMITGFLFFSKILSFDKPLNVRVFFSSRIKRLIPAMCSCFFLYALVCYTLRDQSNQSSFIDYLISWFSFGFIGLPKLSESIPGWSVTAGVFWTLVLEWKFYILIPFFSVFIIGKRTALIFFMVIVALILYLYSKSYYTEKDASIYLCFMAGFAISLFNNYCNRLPTTWIASPLTSFLCIIIYIYSFYYTYGSYNFTVTFATCIFLTSVIFGNSFFGILKIKALHWAGKSSYSIYIMHALIMHIVFPVTARSIGYYWSLFVAASFLCVLALLNYIFVEKSYMHSNKYFTQTSIRG